jgi:gliding motility-associated-like protein
VDESPTAPTAGFSDINNFCEDDAGNINLMVSGGSGGTVHWFDDACAGNEIGTGNPLTILSPAINTTYYASYESVCGVSSCFSFDVTVVEPPVEPIKATSDINDICADHPGTIELTAVGGSGEEAQWFTGSCGGTSVGVGNPLVLPSPDVTTIYYVRWANACGETDCAIHTVTVFQLPTDPTSVISDINDFCVDYAGNIELTLNGGTGDDVYWYTVSCGDTPAGSGNPLVIETPASDITYYARWENACGLSSCEYFDINVVDMPVAPTSIVPSANNICDDDVGTFDLAAVGGSGITLRWYTGSCEGTDIGIGNPLTIDTPTETTEYFVSWENACGVSSCASVIVSTIDAPVDPTEAQVDISEVCFDDAGDITLTLVGGAGPTVEWYSGSCGGTPVGTGNPLVIESPTVNTTYYGRYESSCGISTCESVDVTVDVLPLAPTSASVDRTDFCSDDAGVIELSVIGGSGDDVYWYTISCGDTPVGNGNPLSIDSPTETTVYYGRWENSCGASTCEFVTVNVLELPVAPLSITPSADVICTDDAGTFDLVAVGGSGDIIRWYTGSCEGTDIGIVNPLTIDTPTETTEYFVSWENTCGVSSCASVIINIIDAPADPTEVQVDFSEVCIDDAGDITLTLVGGIGPIVEWYSGSCGGTPVGTGNPLVIESPIVNTTYYGRYESSCGISACESVDVTVNLLPTAPISALVDRTDFCSDDAGVIELSVTGGSGDDVYWYTVSCGDTPVGNGNPLSIDSPEVTTIYYGRWESSCGVSVCQDVTVTVIPSADATINPTGPFCLTSSPTVVTAAQIGGTWSGDGIDPITGLFTPSTAGLGDHTITYTITGTCGDIDETIITVLDAFDATIDDVDPLCEGDSPITLTAATEGGEWSGDGITDTDAGTFDPTAAGVGSHTIIYQNTGACGGSDDIIIVVSPSADATITEVGPFCEDAEPIVVTAAETGGIWSGTAIDPTTGLFDPEVAGVGDHVITYTIAGTCGDVDQTTISVIEYFDATITSGLDFCYRDSLGILLANTEGGTWEGADIVIYEGVPYLVFTNIGAGDYEIIYHYDGLCGDADTVTVTIHPDVDAMIYPVDTLTDEDDPVQLLTIQEGGVWDGIYVDYFGVFDPLAAGAASHQVIYTIDGLCGDADTIKIIVIPAPLEDLLIPTVITPDNDGYNDRWRIEGIEAYDQVSIKIFTRWGDEVFTFEGTGAQYADPLNQWDGRRNDKDLPTGSYVYILILNNGDAYKGTLSLIR